MAVSSDYRNRVYAGILGKMIGVYWGRPVEGWSLEQITALGPFDGYLNDRLGVPLVVTDDDLSGTFTFPRALEDHGYRPGVGAQEIGETWLNYLIEGKTVLWWGGRGTSTEHTAYLNLRAGTPAPASGSSQTNGATVAHQIGAMIFIDAWAMLCPGDPEAAARWARRAASVSHDGVAVDAAVAVAVMEAMAFVESDIPTLVGHARRALAPDSLVVRLIDGLTDLRTREPDWRRARAWIEEHHGYHLYPGTCHSVPNFCLIVLGLLWGDGDFRRSLALVIAAGWDTDCNAANLGCLLGIRGGTAAVDACPDLRQAPRDLVLLSNAQGEVTDAARLAVRLINDRQSLAGEQPWTPAGGDQFAFPFPGAWHGFRADASSRLEADSEGLAWTVEDAGTMKAPVFVHPDEHTQPTYDFVGSPGVFPGQTLRARVSASGPGVRVRGITTLVGDQGTTTVGGPLVELAPGSETTVAWQAGGSSLEAILEVGLEAQGPGRIRLHSLGWSGTPTLVYDARHRTGRVWRSTWVSSVDRWWPQFVHAFHLVKNRGTGLVYQGHRSWTDYRVSAVLTGVAARRWGLVFRCQGLQRYLALTLTPTGRVSLVRQWGSGAPTTLAEGRLSGILDDLEFTVEVRGDQITARVGSVELGAVCPTPGGAYGLLVEEGTLLGARLSMNP